MVRAVLCVIIAATAASAWDGLTSVPEPAAVEAGACITYGAGYIWGVFPTTYDEVTYAGYYEYDEWGGEWTLFGEEMATEVLTNTAVTFQWLEEGVLFVVGNEDGQSILYWYSLLEEEWNEEEIDSEEEFELGAGACIAYQPNVNYDIQCYPVPGWVYCLAGGGDEFWRYAIPSSLPPVALNGIYPGQGSVLADQTPHFMWQGNGASQYRLMVSTDPNFTATGLDTVVSATEYDVTNPMDNDTYYWRTGTQNFGIWNWSLTHSFDLDGGWGELAAIPTAVGEGAAMAYDGDYFNHQSILALPGGGSNDFWEYDIVAGEWNQKGSTTIDEIVGTSLVTHEATEQAGSTPWCTFGGSGTSDYLWYYGHFGWAEWEEGPTYLQWIGPGSSMAYGPDHHVYLIVGEDANGDPRNDFYRQQLPWAEEGPEAAATLDGKSPARVISSFDGISVVYQLRAPSRVRATLHDVTGRLVGKLDAGEQMTGSHRLDLTRDADGQRLASGAYFVLLDMGTEQARLKAVIQ